MNCSVVSERRKWWETECSLRTCTTLTNGSAISTNTLTDTGSTDRTGMGSWRDTFVILEEGNRTDPGKERASSALCNKNGTSLESDMQCYIYSFIEVCLSPESHDLLLRLLIYSPVTLVAFITVIIVHCWHFLTLALHVFLKNFFVVVVLFCLIILKMKSRDLLILGKCSATSCPGSLEV